MSRNRLRSIDAAQNRFRNAPPQRVVPAKPSIVLELAVLLLGLQPDVTVTPFRFRLRNAHEQSEELPRDPGARKHV